MTVTRRILSTCFRPAQETNSRKNMKAICCILPVLLVLFSVGCWTIERPPARMAETALVSREATYVTIEMIVLGREETDGSN